MTENEFLAFAEEAIPAFAADKTTSGHWSPDEALELSRKSFEELLPHGLASPDNFLFTIRDPANEASVGVIWIAVQEQGGKRIAYVYNVTVQPEHQRKGHATRDFLALESEVQKLGLSGIALNVFGHNAGAHALYVKLGYQPTNINMFKAIGKTR